MLFQEILPDILEESKKSLSIDSIDSNGEETPIFKELLTENKIKLEAPCAYSPDEGKNNYCADKKDKVSFGCVLFSEGNNPSNETPYLGVESLTDR